MIFRKKQPTDTEALPVEATAETTEDSSTSKSLWRRKSSAQKELKEKEVKKVHRVTLYDKVRNRLNATRIAISFLSMILYTLFTVIMLHQNWGKTAYLYVIMGFLAFYILLFALIIIITKRNSKKLTRSMKDYKSGLKILRALLQLTSLMLSLSIFASASTTKNIGTPFQITVLVLSLTWSLFQIVFQLSRILKRHGLIGKKDKKRVSK